VSLFVMRKYRVEYLAQCPACGQVDRYLTDLERGGGGGFPCTRCNPACRSRGVKSTRFARAFIPRGR